MFTNPRLPAGQTFPDLPTDHPDWPQLLDTVEVSLEPDKDPLLALTKHAIGWVEEDSKYTRDWHKETVATSSRTPLFRRCGFVDMIPPPTTAQDFTIMDGGHLHRYQARLGHFSAMEQQGLIESPNLIVFAGQRLRTEGIDSYDKLSAIARGLQGNVDKATDTWLSDELAKDPENPNKWQRPFATERELGRLGLAMRYGVQLHYQGTISRSNPQQLHPSIPVPFDAADEFSVNDQRVVLLNAPAKIREHAGRKKDISQARPTGRSCFYEWLQLDQPSPESTIMLATSAPNIYRSWFDMLLRAVEAGRQDLRLSATGTAIRNDATVGSIVTAFGDLIVNFYNLKYEDGIDSPQTEPFKI